MNQPRPRPAGDREDDLGLFGPDSVSWRVHAEPILALAGLRALYLQALHPRAIAGVVQNSGYRADPWGRLQRTVEYVVTVVYGTTGEAERAGRRVRALHGRLHAVDPASGAEFRLDEPDLLRWVHVTEIESFLSVAQRAGVGLTAAEVDRYFDEQRRAAALVGLDPAGVPGSAAQVAAYYRRIRPDLGMTRDAAEAALFLSTAPMPGLLGYTPLRLAWTGVAALAVGLLPAWARRYYGLPGVPVTDVATGLAARSLRLVMATVPRRVFEGPRYRAAMARARRYRDATR